MLKLKNLLFLLLLFVLTSCFVDDEFYIYSVVIEDENTVCVNYSKTYDETLGFSREVSGEWK